MQKLYPRLTAIINITGSRTSHSCSTKLHDKILGTFFYLKKLIKYLKNFTVTTFYCKNSSSSHTHNLSAIISKRVFQENKARQIFLKMKISYPLMLTRTCGYQGVRNVCFSESCHTLFSCNTHFLQHPRFTLLTYYQWHCNFERCFKR